MFDLDGTLYDKRPVERLVIRRLLLSLPRLVRYTRVRQGLAGVDLGSWEALGRETLARLGGGERAQRAWTRWIGERYEPTVLAAVRAVGRPYPGVDALLVRLRRAGLKVGLVSDYRGAEDRLRALEIDPSRFDFTLVTEEQGAMKPAPRMAARTLAGMDLPASSLVMVGDRAFADQRFAEAAGMGFVGVLAERRAEGPGWFPWPAARERLAALAEGV